MEAQSENCTKEQALGSDVPSTAYDPHYLIQFFSYQHLPDHLRKVSEPFGIIANNIDAQLPGNPEKTTALRKLLEAKDCAVRAVLFK